MAPKKQQKMSLGTFLQDENYGSWADEMEDMPLPATDSRPAFGSGGFGQRREFSSNATTGAERSFERQGYSVREQLPLPTAPPYTAHLANLSFDVTQPDVEEFFRECEVTNVRIVEDKMDRKPKGFGYVEFGSLDGLKKALELTGSNLAGRQVRISVADPPKDRGGDPSRDFSDWSRKGPLPDLPQNNRRVSERQFSNRGFNSDNMSDAGSERGNRRPFGADREPSFRDMSNASWERKGPLSPVQGQDLSLRGAGRQGSREGGFRKDSPSWGEGKSQEGSRPPRRDPAITGAAPERPVVHREPTAAEMDNHWRSKMQPDAPTPKSPEPETSTPASPAATSAAAPGGRPRLNLQKRTVSEAVAPTSPSAEGDAKASPFGAARPIDTAAREREVEEKRQLAIRQKREADEKAKAERVEQKKNEKEREKPVRQNSTKEGEAPAEANDDEAEEGSESKAAQPKFDILRRQASDNNDMIADDDETHEDAEETPAPENDKAVKPREVVRDIPKNANGSWRKKDQAPKQSAPANSETAALEADGWSTVSKGKKQQNNRRQPARAIAS